VPRRPPVRVYRLKLARDLRSIEAALRALDSREIRGPLDSGRDVEEGVRVVKLERLEFGTSSARALVRVSYKAKGLKMWSDLYDFEFTVTAGGVVVTVRRVSGLGRTDPEFIVGEIARLLTQGESRSPASRS